MTTLLLGASLALFGCGGDDDEGSGSSGSENSFDFSGTYSVTYEITKGTSSLPVGSYSGDPVIVQSNGDQLTMSFGIPGQFWTEFTTSYGFMDDPSDPEYQFDTTDNLDEGGSLLPASFYIEGQFEPQSVWAHIRIVGTETIELDIRGNK